MSSRWSEFGFPDLNGVSMEKAIAGLFLAVYERMYALFGTGYQMPPEIVNHLAPIWRIEMFLRGYHYELLLPDGTPYSGEAAAEYLGEELIPVPVRGDGYSWVYPYPPISREWLQQRYRMVNLIYQCAPSNPWDAMVTVSGYAYVNGDTIAEAWNAADAAYTETDYSGWLYRAWVSLADWGRYYSAERTVSVPRCLIYQCHLTGNIVETFTAHKAGDIFDDFGTGITVGKHTRTIEAPSGVAFGDTVNYPGASETLARLRTIRGTNDFITRGFQTTFVSRIYDIRKGLEFYDPIEGE